MFFSGDAPVCDPKTYYECGAKALYRYVIDNEAEKCNCPRQCRQLQYRYSISQAKLSNFIVTFAKAVFQMDETLNEIRNDHVSLEVSKLAFAVLGCFRLLHICFYGL